MIQALLEGMSMGLLLSAIVGPVFFSLIQNSLEHGFNYAATLAFGILLSDSIYVILTFFGIKLLSDTTYIELVLGYVGGTILAGFGVNSLLNKQISRPNTGGIEIPVQRKRTALVKGFGINGVNPFVLLFWISIASLVSLKTDWTGGDILNYYLGILLTVFCIDLCKAFMAKQLSHLMTPRLMWLLKKSVGLVMIYFGLRMVWITYSA